MPHNLSGQKGGNNLRYFSFFIAAGLLLLVPPIARAAETVHLYLVGAQGQAIKGESIQTSLGRQDSIECVQVDMNVMNDTALRADTIRVIKRIDKSSATLLRSLVSREVMKSAVFKFFRPNPTGDGTTQQFYTVTLNNARIVGIKQFVPNCIEPASSNYPPQEIVTIGFSAIRWTYLDGTSAEMGSGTPTK